MAEQYRYSWDEDGGLNISFSAISDADQINWKLQLPKSQVGPLARFLARRKK